MVLAYQRSLEEQVLEADPVELVCLLLDGAVAALRAAQACAQDGDLLERGRHIGKVSTILAELAMTLKHTEGESLSHNLAELYDYVQRLLLDSQVQADGTKLAEAERLLTTLLEGWRGLQQAA